MVDVVGGYYIGNPYDWGRPKASVLVEDSTTSMIDLSSRLISAEVTLNDSYAADSFSLQFTNAARYISDNFDYGAEAQISLGFNQYGGEIVLTGRVEDPEISYTKKAGSIVSFAGKDWISELQNRIVLEVYKNGTFTAATDPYMGEIVRDLVGKYCPAIGAANVPDTAYQLPYKIFARMSVYDCLKFIADLISYRFYVDANKQLVFEPIPTVTLIEPVFGTSGDPAGWTENAGTWAQAASTYRQTDDTGAFVSYRTTESFTTALIDTLLIINSGTGAGVALRIDTGTGNHYAVMLHVEDNTVRLLRVAAWTGAQTEIFAIQPLVPLALATEYQLRVFCRNDVDGNAHFKVFLDDMISPIFIYSDAGEYVASGKCGLRTDDADASFYGLTIANASLVIEEGQNAKDMKVKRALSQMKNNIYVQGGYERFPKKEVVTPSGSTDAIVLTYLPTETRVTNAGGTVLKGGIKGIDDADATVDFLVDYYAKTLYYRTGNWPATATTIEYLANVPLYANLQDTTTFGDGTRDYILTDKTLNTQALVEDKAQQLLDKLGVVPLTVTAPVVAAVWPIPPGDLVLVKGANADLASYNLLASKSISIKFDKRGGMIWTFTLNTEQTSLALLLNSIENRLRKLEQRDIPEALIRIEPLTDTATIQDAIVGDQNDISTGFKLGHYAKLGHNRKLGNASSGWTSAF